MSGKGTRIALRGKVNDGLITGITGIDCMLPIGRGQRQLVLGDRWSGKSSVFMNVMLVSMVVGGVCGVEGGKRLFCL